MSCKCGARVKASGDADASSSLGRTLCPGGHKRLRYWPKNINDFSAPGTRKIATRRPPGLANEQRHPAGHPATSPIGPTKKANGPNRRSRNPASSLTSAIPVRGGVHKNDSCRLSVGQQQVALVTENERQAAASGFSALGSSSSAAVAALRSPGLAEANSPRSPAK
jgi:hypothetical protein